MISQALVTLDTETGKLNRYLRGEGGEPEWTSSASFNGWEQYRFDEALCWDEIQNFRKGYMPPPPAPDNDPLPPAVGAAGNLL